MILLILVIKNGSRAGAGNYSGMEYGYVNNLYLKNAKVSETGGYGVYVSNTYTGIVRLDVEANQIQNSAASNDVMGSIIKWCQ